MFLYALLSTLGIVIEYRLSMRQGIKMFLKPVVLKTSLTRKDNRLLSNLAVCFVVIRSIQVFENEPHVKSAFSALRCT